MAFCVFSPKSLPLQTDQIYISNSHIGQYIDQSTITDIFEDSNGFLWVGTQQGLYQFDGAESYKFDSNIKAEPWHIAHSNITGILEDSKNRIIFSTHSGNIYRWNYSKNKFEDLVEISGLVKSNSLKLIYLSRDISVFRYPKKTFVFNLKKLEESTSLGKELSRDDYLPLKILRLNSDQAIAASNDRIYTINFENSTVNSILHQKNDQITSLTKNDHNEVLFTTSKNQIFSLNIKDRSLKHLVDLSFEKPTIITDLEFALNHLWVGTSNGLVSINIPLKHIRYFTTKNSELSHDYITDIFYNGIFWIGTYHGLDQFFPSIVTTYNSSNSAIYNDVLAFAEDKGHNIWVGTYNGLYKYDPKISKHVEYESGTNPLIDQRIMSLASKGNKLWVGLQKYGVYIIDTETLSSSPISDTIEADLSITKILHSSDGGTWIATYNKGLFSYNQNNVISHQDSIPEASIIIVIECSNGVILAASEKSLYTLNHLDHTFIAKKIIFPHGFEDSQILSLVESNTHLIIVGTKDHGLFQFPLNSLGQEEVQAARFGNDTEVSNSTMYGLLYDKNNILWSSTQNGLFGIDEMGHVAHRLTKANGLQGDDFNFGAYLLSSKNLIYFGGVNGYSVFSPESIIVSSKKPRVYIRKISISGKDYIFRNASKETQSIEAPRNTSSISIHFAVADFSDSTNNRYKYKLEGLDETWIDNGTRNIATYRDLNEGDYVFKVIAANAAGVWNTEGASLRIRILPHWWQTWWAYTFYMVFASLLAWGIMRIYRTYVLKEQALRYAGDLELQAYRLQNEIEEQHEYQDGVIAAIHAQNLATLELVGNCVSALNGHSDSEANTLGHLQCMQLLEECTHYQAGHLLVDLRNFTDSIADFLIQHTPVDAGTITTINNVKTSLIPAHNAAPIAIIIYELLQNALVHAFLPTSPANYVEVDFDFHAGTDEEAGCYRLAVSDDGRGLPPQFTPATAETAGFRIVRELTGSLGGAIRFEGTCGTHIVIDFPPEVITA